MTTPDQRRVRESLQDAAWCLLFILALTLAGMAISVGILIVEVIR